MISVAEVLHRPLFQHAKLVAGWRGMGRNVGWVHIVEVKNAGLYINRDNLLLSTGLSLSGMNEKEREEYMKELIQHGVAGLCIELGDSFRQLPPDMLTFADRHDFPLIVFNEPVRFVEITQDIHSLLVNSQLTTLKNLTAFSQELQRIMVQATSIRPFLAALHKHVSHQIVYYCPGGESLLTPVCTPQQLRDITGLYGEALGKSPLASEQACVLQLDARRFILSQPVISLGQTAAYTGLIISGEKVSETLLMSLDYTVKSITNFLLRLLFVEERERQSHNLFLHEILSGDITDEEQARSRLGLTFPPAASPVFIGGIVQIEYAAFGYGDESTGSVGHNMVLLARSLLRKQGIEAFLTLKETKVYILCLAKVSPDSLSIKMKLQNFVKQLEQSALLAFEGSVRTAVGFGQTKSKVIEARLSFKEAEETLNIAKKIPDRHFFEDLGVYQLLSGLSYEAFVPAFIEAHIGKLLDYDKKNNAQLLQTLRVYLKHMGSKQLAAQELFIHRQTLYHRLEKCRELLGDDYVTQEKRLCIETAILFHSWRETKT
jgi:purine catabolism regulator